MKEINNEKVQEIIDSLYEDDFVKLNNNYCDAAIQTPEIYPMSEFDDVMNNESPSDIAMKILNGDFSIFHSWFIFDGYDNLVSSYDPQTLVVVEDIINYIIDNKDSLDCEEIQDYLDECEEDDED